MILFLLARLERNWDLEGFKRFCNLEYRDPSKKVGFKNQVNESKYHYLLQNGLSSRFGFVEKGRAHGRHNMNVTVREASKNDLQQIIALLSELSTKDEHNITLEKAGAIFQRMDKYPFFKVYIAVFNEQIVGAFELLVMDNLAHSGLPFAIIEDVVVAGEHQRQGIGKAMMHYAMNVCREMGCYKVTLSSNLKRKDAHRFYESLGFQKHGFSFYAQL